MTIRDYKVVQQSGNMFTTRKGFRVGVDALENIELIR
jgi:hypothetical protein